VYHAVLGLNGTLRGASEAGCDCLELSAATFSKQNELCCLCVLLANKAERKTWLKAELLH